MKSVLVIDTPQYCDDCPCHEPEIWGNTTYCQINDEPLEFVNGQKTAKPEWCPLKPMPQKCGSKRKDDEVSKLIALGWNACIDYLEGKE